MEKSTIKKHLRAGKIYARVDSVAPSGMSRRILYYTVVKSTIINITQEIGEMAGYLKPDQQKQYGKNVWSDGLRVGGCGMDMIWHVLTNANDGVDVKYNYL